MRRIRAAVLLVGLWGFVWAVGGFVLGYFQLRSSLEFNSVNSLRGVVRVLLTTFSLTFGALGALNGLIFAGVLASVGTRRPRGQKLSASRIAQWGALASVLLASAFVIATAIVEREVPSVLDAMTFLCESALLGAGCSLGTFALAGGPKRVGSHNAIV